MKIPRLLILIVVIGLFSFRINTFSLTQSISGSGNDESITSTSLRYHVPQNLQDLKDISTRPTSEIKTHAVIHMGIHKTGTSSIQSQSKRHGKELQLDGYQMPWLVRQEDTTGRYYSKGDINKLPCNQVQFANCFTPEAGHVYSLPCDEELLAVGTEIAKQKQNLLATAEDFSKAQKEGLEALYMYLSKWDDISIVVYHRRFYSWIISWYNQMNKASGAISIVEAAEKRQRQSIIDYIEATMSSKSSEEPKSHHSFFLLERIKNFFDSNSIVLMDYHDQSKGDVIESFYCHAMPNATNTCNAIRRQGDTIKANSARETFDYEDLVYIANMTGLIRIKNDADFKMKARKVKNFQENVLKKTSNDFKRICPSPVVLEDLWDFSLKIERSLFPEYFFNDEGDGSSLSYLATLRLDFEKTASSTMCKLDLQAILNQQQWKSFFRRLEKKEQP